MSLPSLSLEGKVAIVTGARRGLGKAIALLLAEAGANVTVADIVIEGGELEATAKEIQALGQRSLVVQTDVTRKADVDNMVQKTVKELGGVDILVNDAGISTRVTTMEISEEEWDRVTDVDFKGCFLCAQAAGRRMIEQGRGGSIINISSTSGLIAQIDRGGYCAAKAGLIMLTKQLAIELAPHNIRVNAIAPGWMSTGRIAGIGGIDYVSDPEVKKRNLALIPIKRYGEPKDIANGVLYLASDLGSYVTGVTLCIDGGETASSANS